MKLSTKLTSINQIIESDTVKWKGRFFRERFWSKVRKSESDKCWIWIGAKSDNGYGVIRIGMVYHQAHRISFLIHNETINPNLLVIHSCDNPECVNPSHLSQGTIQDNIADSCNKGRRPNGERIHTHKLTADCVAEIRRLFGDGTSMRNLSEMYGVTRPTIREVVKRTSWRHVS